MLKHSSPTPRLAEGQFFGAPELTRGSPDIAVSITAYAPAARLAPHAHLRPYVSIVLGGQYIERVGSTALECSLLTMRYHPAEEEHANDFGTDGGRCLNLELSARWDESLERLPRAQQRPLLLEHAGALGLRVARAARVHAQRMFSLPEGRPDNSDFDIEMESIVADLLALCEVHMRRHRAVERSPAMGRGLEFVEAHLHESFSLADVAAVAGLHPTHFARSCRALTGLTLGEYVRRRRVTRAEHLLLYRPSVTVSRVAAELGFADHAHLTRTFRRAAGVTPSGYRAALVEEGMVRPARIDARRRKC
jgi:AraC family transcriptional regulator